jgi:PKD repeat protein
MSKFLSILEQYSPENTGDPKWELIDFLKSKNIAVSLVKGTDMVYVDTGNKTIALTVSNNEEEAETINSDQELNNIVSSGGPVSGKAAQILKKKRALAPKIVNSAENQLKETERMLNKPKSPIIR